MKGSIRREVRAFVAERAASSQVATAWDEPVVGFVAADDPGFAEVRQLLGLSHAMPHDLMPSARSVVALFAPYARQLARDNRPGRRPARSWCLAFTETREMLDAVGGTRVLPLHRPRCRRRPVRGSLRPPGLLDPLPVQRGALCGPPGERRLRQVPRRRAMLARRSHAALR